MKVEAVMSTKKIFPGMAFVAAAVVAVPFLFADRRSGPPRVPFGDAQSSGDVLTPPGSTGWGKGSVTLPAGELPGMLVGVLTGSDGSKYMVDAELTGFMPSTIASGGPEYWFGGIYGRMQQVMQNEPMPGEDPARWFEIEGTWVLDKSYSGTFSAQLLDRNDAGIQFVCGIASGHFKVSEAMPGPAPAPGERAGALPAGIGDDTCFKFFDDRARYAKPVEHKGPLGDRASEGPIITCPHGEGPLVVIQTAKTPPDDGQPCTAGWRDAHATTSPFDSPKGTRTWPILMGAFDLRYQLYE